MILRMIEYFVIFNNLLLYSTSLKYLLLTSTIMLSCRIRDKLSILCILYNTLLSSRAFAPLIKYMFAFFRVDESMHIDCPLQKIGRIKRITQMNFNRIIFYFDFDFFFFKDFDFLTVYSNVSSINAGIIPITIIPIYCITT